jgi:hypothetical protein
MPKSYKAFNSLSSIILTNTACFQQESKKTLDSLFLVLYFINVTGNVTYHTEEDGTMIRDCGMTRTPVESSNIASIGWEFDSHLTSQPTEQDIVGTLQIEFHHGGVYNYRAVPKQIAEALVVADSIGKAFHAQIRGGGYPSAKVEQEEEIEQEEPWDLNQEIASGDRSHEMPDYLL